MNTVKQKTPRQRLNARLHINKAKAKLTEEKYAKILMDNFNVNSSVELDEGALLKLVIMIEKLAGKPQRSHPPRGRLHNIDEETRGPYLRKINAYLAEAKRPVEYADEIAWTMFKIDKIEWCNAKQLRAIIAALNRDAKRNGRRL